MLDHMQEQQQVQVDPSGHCSSQWHFPPWPWVPVQSMNHRCPPAVSGPPVSAAGIQLLHMWCVVKGKVTCILGCHYWYMMMEIIKLMHGQRQYLHPGLTRLYSIQCVHLKLLSIHNCHNLSSCVDLKLVPSRRSPPQTRSQSPQYVSRVVLEGCCSARWFYLTHRCKDRDIDGQQSGAVLLD